MPLLCSNLGCPLINNKKSLKEAVEQSAMSLRWLRRLANAKPKFLPTYYIFRNVSIFNYSGLVFLLEKFSRASTKIFVLFFEIKKPVSFETSR